FFNKGKQNLWRTLVAVANFITQFCIIQKGIFLNFGAKIYFRSIFKRIQRVLFFVEFQITFRQIVVVVFGHGILSVNNFIEFANGIFVIALFIIGVAQLVIISVIPSAAHSFIFLQIWNCLDILTKIEITLTNDF